MKKGTKRMVISAVARLLAIAVFVLCLPSVTFASVNAPAELNEISQYLHASETIADDGRIGIPVNVHTYYDDTKTYKSGADSSNVVMYVMNTNTERIGKKSDAEIIRGLIERDFFVIVVDYMNNEKTNTHELDWSLQDIRAAVNTGSYTDNQMTTAENVYILPAGYDIEYNIKYFSIDEYGVAGTLDYIVETWLNDFASIHADDIMTVNGVEMTVREYTAQFNDKNPMTIYDCLKPDGTPIDLNLYMDIIYPTDADETVPVMIHKSSSESRAGRSLASDRPQFTGLLFNGYAGVVADYGFMPMARNDHFGAFQGTGDMGAVSGLNTSYSIGIFNDVKADTALVRQIRTLADPTNENREYNFDVDAIGIYGNSKGGHIFRLGSPNPEDFNPLNILQGYGNKTRYEAMTELEFYNDPYVNDAVNNPQQTVIREPKEQPFLTYSDGSKIPSNVNYVYASVGLGYENITEGAAPIFNTGTMLSGGSYSGIYTLTEMAARTADVPSIHLVCPGQGHTYGYGTDRDYGVDVYQAFMDHADYWLKDSNAKVLYIDAPDEYVSDSKNDITITFTGAVAEEEIQKVQIINDVTGKAVPGVWTSSYGNQTWCFVPHGIEGGCTYTVNVPATLKAENGKNIDEAVSKTFTTKWEQTIPAQNITHNIITNDGMYMIFPEKDYKNAGNVELRFSVTNDAANRVIVYPITSIDKTDITRSIKGENLGDIVIIGAGDYSIDVTDYVVNCEGTPAFYIATKKGAGEFIVNSVDFETKSDIKISGGSFVHQSVADDNLPGGNGKAWKNSYSLRFSTNIDINNNLANNFQYRSQTVFGSSEGIKATALDESDYGRKFVISYRVYDTTRRLLTNTFMSGAKNGQLDSDGYVSSWYTTPDTWVDYEMEYVIDDREDWELFDKRNFEVIAEIKSIATIPNDVAVAPRGYAAGEYGASKGGNYAGTQGLNDTVRVYKTVADAEKAGEVTVLKEQPIYFDDLTFTEVITDVDIAMANGAEGTVPVLVTHPENTMGYLDVRESDWFYDSVKAVADAGIMNGITDIKFEPYTNVTRAMFVTTLWRLAGNPDVQGEIKFKDVPADSWYAKAVLWATAKGITDGVTNTEFMPDDKITREQMATMILRFANGQPDENTACNYKDMAEISAYAKPGVIFCYEKGIMTGNADGTFAPKTNATRAELAAVLQRIH